MKLSELIAALLKLQEQYGPDIKVLRFTQRQENTSYTEPFLIVQKAKQAEVNWSGNLLELNEEFMEW